MGWLPGCNCRCGSSGFSSSGGGSSGSGGGTLPETVGYPCSEARCAEGVMARNYRIDWNWPAPIYPGEVVLSHDDNPFTNDFWHVKTYGSVCTHKYNTGGWTVRYVGGQPVQPGSPIVWPHCTWASDERLPAFKYTSVDDGTPAADLGYPLSCVDIPNQPLVTMTLGWNQYEPLYSGYHFFVVIRSPVTGSPRYPSVRITYIGKTVSDDGIKNDCMAAMTLEASPHPIYYNMSYPSGIAYEDGGFPVLETPFTFNGAFYDPAYIFDPNAIGPDDLGGYWRRCPPIPLTLPATPA